MIPFKEAEKGQSKEATLGLSELRITTRGTFLIFWCYYYRKPDSTDSLRICSRDKDPDYGFYTKEVDTQPLSTYVMP